MKFKVSAVHRLSLWAVLAAPLMVCAQAFPSKQVTLVVPFPPGGGPDVVARVIAEKLAPRLGQPVVVENRPGAGGTLGATQVARSDPDGHTLVVVSTGHVVNPALYGNLQYDTLGDFVGVSPLATLPSVLVVGSGSPIKSVAELIAAARAKPGALNYASAGVGSAT
ncbi:MAG: Bug family tripartite tricarboxylate transporter substrate binding protein, partial [Betaproteobacteria bacterium]